MSQAQQLIHLHNAEPYTIYNTVHTAAIRFQLQEPSLGLRIGILGGGEKKEKVDDSSDSMVSKGIFWAPKNCR